MFSRIVKVGVPACLVLGVVLMFMGVGYPAMRELATAGSVLIAAALVVCRDQRPVEK
jgi:hypothetical protein